jgi:hypothetical protein
MIHFLYLVGYGFFVAIVFGAIASGSYRDKTLYGLKIFAQFIVISLILAWVFYFLPW